MNLTALDMIVVLLVGAGAAFGVMRGFVAEVLSLFAWFLAIMALSYFHVPVANALEGPVGSGAWLLAFALLFGSVFILGKIASRRVGERVRKSVVGPLDRVLGGIFGALKGLLGATVLFLGFSLVYDTIWTRSAERPEWIANARSYPLLRASAQTVSGLVEARRGPERPEANTNAAR